MPNCLDPETAKRVKEFTKRVDATQKYFLSMVVNEWLDEKGEEVAARVEARRRDVSRISSEMKAKVASISTSDKFQRTGNFAPRRALPERLAAVP